MAYATLCLFLVLLVSVKAGLEISKEVEETIHIKYRADTVLRYQRHHGRRGGPSFISKYWARDSGHIKNCVKGTKSKMDMTWTPKVVNITSKITVDVDVVLPVAFKTMRAMVNIFIPGNETPFASIPEEVKCDDIRPYLPPPLNESCPIKAGKELKMKRTFDLNPYSSEIPEGTFIYVIRVKNENEKDMFCLNATVTTVSNGF